MYVYSLLGQTGGPLQRDTGEHGEQSPQVVTATSGLEFAYGPVSELEPSSILNNGSERLEEKGI